MSPKKIPTGLKLKSHLHLKSTLPALTEAIHLIEPTELRLDPTDW